MPDTRPPNETAFGLLMAAATEMEDAMILYLRNLRGAGASMREREEALLKLAMAVRQQQRLFDRYQREVDRIKLFAQRKMGLKP